MAAKSKSEGPKKKYRVVKHVTHDGETYGPGGDNEHIDLVEAHAAPLLADKCIEPVEDAKAEK